MPSKPLCKSSLSLSHPFSSAFEFEGYVDAELISSFARKHPEICIDVRTILEFTSPSDINRVYKIEKLTQFNTTTTQTFFARPGLISGSELSELHTRGIFYQATRPICIIFRDGEHGIPLAFFHFKKKENIIEGSIYMRRSHFIEKPVPRIRFAFHDGEHGLPFPFFHFNKAERAIERINYKRRTHSLEEIKTLINTLRRCTPETILTVNPNQF